MTKDQAKQLILALAARNDGKVSFRTFVDEAGIPGQRLRRESWFPGWNALLIELGLATETFVKPRAKDEDVAEAVAVLVTQLGHWPTEDEFVREKKANKAFPDIQVIRRVKKSGQLWSLLKMYRIGDASFEIVRSVAASKATSDHIPIDDDTASPRVSGFVYMMRSGRRYKIGFTNSLVRRFREVRIELPDETIQIHSIETDDPRGIEEYWHKRFAAKRIRNSEWFELDADDVRAFKRRKYQ
jgi:hypothetical protein